MKNIFAVILISLTAAAYTCAEDRRDKGFGQIDTGNDILPPAAQTKPVNEMIDLNGVKEQPAEEIVQPATKEVDVHGNPGGEDVLNLGKGKNLDNEKKQEEKQEPKKEDKKEVKKDAKQEPKIKRELLEAVPGAAPVAIPDLDKPVPLVKPSVPSDNFIPEEPEQR